MKTTQALEDPTEDDLPCRPTDDEAADCRERATAMLDQISREAKQALAEEEIALSLFFLVNAREPSILTFGTISDPPDELWERVCHIVSAIVQQIVGVDRVELRELAWATTDHVDHDLSQRSTQSAASSAPLPAPTVEVMEADLHEIPRYRRRPIPGASFAPLSQAGRFAIGRRPCATSFTGITIMRPSPRHRHDATQCGVRRRPPGAPPGR